MSVAPPSVVSSANKISAGRLAEVFRQIDFVPREKYGPHSHHRLEINYVKRGSCFLRLNKETVSFRKDDLMVIPSGLSHTFEAGPRGARLIQLEFMPELFSEALRDTGHDSGFLSGSRTLLVVRNNIRIKSLLQTIIWELQHQEDGFKHIVMSGYMQLLILLLREYDTHSVPASYPSVLTRILGLIESSSHYNLTVTEIAAEMNLTTRYIRKLFATHIGMSPSGYILGKKIEYAKELIVNTDMSLKEISSQCGFSSSRHFSACFMRVMGYAPSKHLG